MTRQGALLLAKSNARNSPFMGCLPLWFRQPAATKFNFGLQTLSAVQCSQCARAVYRCGPHYYGAATLVLRRRLQQQRLKETVTSPRGIRDVYYIAINCYKTDYNRRSAAVWLTNKMVSKNTYQHSRVSPTEKNTRDAALVLETVLQHPYRHNIGYTITAAWC